MTTPSAVGDELRAFDWSSLAQELQCPVCLETLRDTVLVQACLHRFCSECIHRCLRAAKLECPTCRIHIPSKRSLRKDMHTDAIVNAFFPPTRRDNSTSRSDVWEWRRFHEQRTASFTAALKNALPATEDSGEVDSAPAALSAVLAGDGSDTTPEASDVGMDVVSPLVPKRKRSLDIAEDEVCVALRYIPNYMAYNESLQGIGDPLSSKAHQRLRELRYRYSLELPYARVPSRARLADIRAYVVKMLLSTEKDVSAPLLRFGLIDEMNKVPDRTMRLFSVMIPAPCIVTRELSRFLTATPPFAPLYATLELMRLREIAR